MAKVIAGIYSICNTVNGKVYIGSTCNLSVRRSRHFRDLRSQTHANAHLQRAFNKHGESAFTFKIIERVDDVSLLIAREQFWIDSESVSKALYNLSPAAGSQLGIKRSDETKARMSESLKGKRITEEQRKRLSAAKLGSKHTPETRAKMSQQRLGNKYRLGSKPSEATRKLLSASRVGNKNALGHVQSEETKRKRIESRRKNKALRLMQVTA